MTGPGAVFNEELIDATRSTLYLVAMLMGFFWPGFLSLTPVFLREIPVMFPVTFGGALVLTAFLELALGEGDLMPEGTATLPGHCLPVHWLLVHVLVIQGLLAPVYIVTGAVSGVSWAHLALCTGVVMLASARALALGRLSRLIFGRHSFSGFLFSRGLLMGDLCLSGLIHPVLNPLYILYRVYTMRSGPPLSAGDGLTHLAWALGGILTLLLCCRLVSRLRLNREAGS